MNVSIDHPARKQLATLARSLACGAISNWQFERQCPDSKDAAVLDICFHGLWPLYDDLVEHKLSGTRALSQEIRTEVARMVVFLHSGRPYRYPRVSGWAQIPVLLLSLATLGWFGHLWQRHLWRGGDVSVWPFYARSEYEAALRHPVFLNTAPPPDTPPKLICVTRSPSH